MPLIDSADADFRVCEISFGTLLEIQAEAESRGFATRWSSVEALRDQVRPGAVLLQSLMREERGGSVRAYRCLALFAATDRAGTGGIVTIDLTPERFASLERLDLDSAVGGALVRVFALATGGLSMVAKA
ncbi:hypothetical protein [Amycolatopsis thermoflava]|uniref:hypothetical protein n=1 Tax=Amycolatopsis thermoflava TaxID=84480 RepID=UPI000423A332|nr:hypothetical protein [Amycolatopsis thermoflava]